MASFKWNPERNRAVLLLAEGYTIDETAKQVGVASRTVDRWKSDIEFAQELDRLSLMVGVASRAERLRIAQKIARKLSKKRVPTTKDLLDWLKYAQSETDGIRLDLTALVEAFTSVAGSGPDDAGAAGEGGEETSGTGA